MKRDVYRRTVWSPTFETSKSVHSIDLRKVALAAAVETMQVDLVARGWVGLFDAMLSQGGSELRWSANGPGGEAEIKRAYSALMGRFFGRAVLRSEHRIKWLRQVSDGMMLSPGVSLRRKIGPEHNGDLPDWVGWDRARGMWAICEAKGSRDPSNWKNGEPAPVTTALKQISRVEVVDSTGPIASEGWVVASRWATEENSLPPVILTVDPLNDGRIMEPDEAARAEGHLRANWYADLLIAVGRPDVAADLQRGQEADERSSKANLSLYRETVGYAALAIDGMGLFPLIGPDRASLKERLLEFAYQRQMQAAVVLIDRDAVASAYDRKSTPDDTDDRPTKFPPFVTAVGFEDDGGDITQDGLTVSWDVESLDLTVSD